MNRRYRALTVSGALASTAFIAALIASGCGSTDCSFTATCVGNGTTTPDAGGDVADDSAVVIPATCDLTKSPKDSPDCVTDGVGIFVSAAGKPDGKGTKADPFPTIAAAVTKAVNTKHPRVYICDGKYNEPIKLTSAVSVYGGFDCAWASTGVKPKITPAKGPAIDVNGVADEVVIQDVDATGSSDATVKGSAAIAAFIVKSKVTLRALALTAGAGQDAAKGAGQSNYVAPASIGNKAVSDKGGLDITCACTDGSKSIGGHGADGAGSNIKNGSSDPAVASPLANSGSTGATSCTPGTLGANGDADGVGEPIMSPGVLTEAGWDVSKLGGSGKNGHPAQGGGGGGAQSDSLFAGGGGGCGGCGGAGGAAGQNGGASIALACIDGVVAVDQSTLTSAKGGRGGDGGDGQTGQDGSGGGNGICKGGTGGVGAGGSGGAGGAGGDSIVIAWKGATAPVVSTTELKAGTGGLGGDGGTGGLGNGTHGTVGKPGSPGAPVPNYHQQ